MRLRGPTSFGTVRNYLIMLGRLEGRFHNPTHHEDGFGVQRGHLLDSLWTRQGFRQRMGFGVHRDALRVTEGDRGTGVVTKNDLTRYWERAI